MVNLPFTIHHLPLTMFRYFRRRLFWAVPTLLVLSLIFFALVQTAADQKVVEAGSDKDSEVSMGISEKEAAQRYSRNRPVFYWSLNTAAQCDTPYLIFPLQVRTRLTRLSWACGSWPAVAQYDAAFAQLPPLPDTLAEVTPLRQALSELRTTDRLDSLGSRMTRVREAARFNTQAVWLPKAALQRLDSAVSQLVATRQTYRRWIPVLRWNGTNNQYHHWIAGILRGDLGESSQDNRSVEEALSLPVCVTLLLNGTGLLLAYLIAVPLGVAMARRRGRWADKLVRSFLLFLYAMPGFWVGGLLITFFATPGFGWHLIPGVGIEQYATSGKTFWVWVLSNGSQFVLPIIVLTLSALATIALQTRGAMLEALGQDYVRTARAKGLSEGQVHWKHAFRNALFPLITLFGSALPTLVGGSLVVDHLFALPGMGTKTLNAFSGGDVGVISAILMALSTLTIIGQLLADFLYGWADPRVQLGRD